MKAGTVQQNKKVAYLPGAKRAIPVKNKLVTGLIIVLILYFTLLFVTQYWRLIQLRNTLATIEEEIRVIRAQNTEMLSEIERLNTPGYVEEMARKELGMVRSGELLFRFRESDNPASEAP